MSIAVKSRQIMKIFEFLFGNKIESAIDNAKQFYGDKSEDLSFVRYRTNVSAQNNLTQVLLLLCLNYLKVKSYNNDLYREIKRLHEELGKLRSRNKELKNKIQHLSTQNHLHAVKSEEFAAKALNELSGLVKQFSEDVDQGKVKPPKINPQR